MTAQNEFDLLSFILCGRISDEATLANYRGPALFSHVRKMGYVAYSYPRQRFVLTEQGLARLTQLQDRLDQQARDEEYRQQALRLERKRSRKDARRSWWQWLLSGLFGVLGLFLGAYLTLSTRWFDWLQSFIP